MEVWRRFHRKVLRSFDFLQFFLLLQLALVYMVSSKRNTCSLLSLPFVLSVCWSTIWCSFFPSNDVWKLNWTEPSMCQSSDWRSSCASCTFYHVFLVVSTVIAVIGAVIGCVGVGIYIPTNNQYQVYRSTLCSIVDHEYETCQDQMNANQQLCYMIVWSVEYYVSGQTSLDPMFATIKKKYSSASEALAKLNVYRDDTNHTCYYHYIRLTSVEWDLPTSPTPYLIMTIVGFSLVFVYIILMGVTIACYCRKKWSNEEEIKWLGSMSSSSA